MQMKQITLKISETETLVLNPRGVNPVNGVATLASTATVPMLEKRVTTSVSQPSRNRKTYKVHVKLQNPVECTSDSKTCEPVVQSTAYVDVAFSFSKVSTAAERAYIRQELIAYLQSDLMEDAIDNLNPLY